MNTDNFCGFDQLVSQTKILIQDEKKIFQVYLEDGHMVIP